MVLVKAGSRQENESISGISHFVEHLMFKGTVRRPNTLIISQELDAIGADYNAETHKDHTAYYIKSEAGRLPMITDALSDMLTESIFSEPEVERERGTILEEINMYEDNPMVKVGNLFEQSLYGKDAPLGRFIIGTPTHIKTIAQKQLVAYWRKHYTADNLVISLSGNFNEQKAKKLLQEKFGRVRSGKFNKVSKVLKISQARRSPFQAHWQKTNQAHLVMGVPGVSYTHPDRRALRLLAIILGGNMSSRLFINVRERLGLCYFIRAGHDAYEDQGAFAIQAGLDLKNIGKALEVISSELSDIKTNSVGEEELERAKQFLVGKMAMDLEDSFEVASFFGRQVLFQDETLTADELLRKIKQVKTQDIKRAANKYLRKKYLRVVALSPIKKMDKFAKYLSF